MNTFGRVNNNHNMQIDKTFNPYISGDAFSNALAFPISKRNNKLYFRDEYLMEISTSLKVLHIGCADHIPLIEDKIKKNVWLHKLLSEKASRCCGIDINEAGLEFMRQLGYIDVVNVNIETEELTQSITSEKWDLVILGEILEHVNNPVLFLQNIKNKLKVCADKLVITAPSALRLNNFKKAIKHQELINSDHRYWFTPYTLAKVGYEAGLTVSSFQMCNSYRPGLVNTFILKRYPALCETIIMSFDLR